MKTDSASLESFRSILERLGRFFAAVPGSLKNHLNRVELIRISISSLTAGGGIFGFLELTFQSVGILFPSPADAALAGAVFTLILEARRRLSQGTEVSVRTASRTHAR